MHFTYPELIKFGMGIFTRCGVPADIAQTIVDSLALAELDGLPSHGFSRIPSYTDQVLSGKCDKNARPVVTRPAPGIIRVDAANGFAFPAMKAGLDAAIPVAKEQGIAMVGITRSHHAGVLGHLVERPAREGLIAIAFSNSPAAMAPWGGKKGTYGTNPIAFGCPRTDNDPLIIDMALSKVARGKIKNAQIKGETTIPEGWALDKDGNPTTDPAAAMAGTMVPLGDAKGAALALMVEILSATINGANHGFEASSFFTADGPAPGIGQSVILIKPEALTPGFAAKLEVLFGFILGQDGVRLPGARRFAGRKAKKEAGVDINDKLYKDLAKRAGIAE